MLQRHQHRRLLDAGGAARKPNVKENHLPCEACRVDLVPVDSGEHERWRRLSFPSCEFMQQLRTDSLIGPNGRNIHLGDRARRRITGEEMRYSRVRLHHPQKYVRGAWRAKVELFRDSLERRRMAEFLLVLSDEQWDPEEGAIKLVQRLALGRLGENRVVK